MEGVLGAGVAAGYREAKFASVLGGLYDLRMRLALVAVLLTGPIAIAAPGRRTSKPTAPARAVAPAPAEPRLTSADSPEDPAAVKVGPQSPHDEGEYGGVKPGTPPRADKKPKRPPSKGTLSWIGFEAKGGGAEVFLQSVAAFEVNQHVEGSTLVVDLSGLDKLGQNTWREVDTRFFQTPLARITAKRVGAVRGKHATEVEVRITFKNPKDAQQGQLRAASEADGMYYQYLSFAGTAP